MCSYLNILNKKTTSKDSGWFEVVKIILWHCQQPQW